MATTHAVFSSVTGLLTYVLTYVILMISGEIGVNLFASISMILEAKSAAIS